LESKTTSSSIGKAISRFNTIRRENKMTSTEDEDKKFAIHMLIAQVKEMPIKAQWRFNFIVEQLIELKKELQEQ
jgi:hypothetical protein